MSKIMATSALALAALAPLANAVAGGCGGKGDPPAPATQYSPSRPEFLRPVAAPSDAPSADNGYAEQPRQGNAEQRVDVVFTGGHDTDPRDKGRPVVLIAAALGVPEEVFREAFKRVQPAPGGTHPDREQVRRNKEVLLQALAPYGVTNERLDEVSNYYRYRPGTGELWPTNAATAYAVLKDGKLQRIVVAAGGSGYSSPPTVTVPGLNDGRFTVQLAYGKEFESNGAVASVNIGKG